MIIPGLPRVRPGSGFFAFPGRGRMVDEVPPVPSAEIEPIIDADIGLDVFARIDPEPVAAASIAQIHRALLANGRDVVVKVRRPGIEEQVELDLDVLRSTARLLE